MAEATENKAEPTGIRTSDLKNALNSKDVEQAIKGGAAVIEQRILQEREAKKVAERKAKQIAASQTPAIEGIKP